MSSHGLCFVGDVVYTVPRPAVATTEKMPQCSLRYSLRRDAFLGSIFTHQRAVEGDAAPSKHDDAAFMRIFRGVSVHDGDTEETAVFSILTGRHAISRRPLMSILPR